MRKSKRIGPNIRTMRNPIMDKLLKEGRVTYSDADQGSFIDWYEKREKEKQEARKEAERIEQERIDHIRCPSCQSNNKKHVVKRDSNGIIGPGYASWVTDEYFVCKECGTRYEDLAKMTDNDE